MSQVSAVSAVSAGTPSKRNRARRRPVLLEPITISQIGAVKRFVSGRHDQQQQNQWEALE